MNTRVSDPTVECNMAEKTKNRACRGTQQNVSLEGKCCFVIHLSSYTKPNGHSLESFWKMVSQFCRLFCQVLIAMLKIF